MPNKSIKPRPTGRSIQQNLGLSLNRVRKAAQYDSVVSGGIGAKKS